LAISQVPPAEDKLDEVVLKKVAETTGGDFYRALDRARLSNIYRRIDEIETRKIG
jgi:Ca-activated chloride channel homolog